MPIAMVCAGINAPARAELEAWLARERGLTVDEYLEPLIDVANVGVPYVGPTPSERTDYWGVRRAPVSYGSGHYLESPVAALRRCAMLKVRFAGVLLLATSFFLTGGLVAQKERMAHVLIETDRGEIELELDAEHAPATVANFLRYIDAGQYDGGRFHRSVRLDNQVRDDVLIEVIQGGRNPEFRGQDFDPIALERTRDTGLRHVDGAISMARVDPDSARSDFFICINDQPSLDYGGARNEDGQGFAAFGQAWCAGWISCAQIHAATDARGRAAVATDCDLANRAAPIASQRVMPSTAVRAWSGESAPAAECSIAVTTFPPTKPAFAP